MWGSGAVVLIFAVVFVSAGIHPRDSCDSEIYCHGDLLHTVQMAKIFPDSKTFVDMRQKQPAAETLAKFKTMMADTHGSPSQDEVRAFVQEAFEAGGELEDWTLPDFKPEPGFLATIGDDQYRRWASDLNHMWKNLSRKMSDDVKLNQDRYSIIYVPNGFVVPGGRFVEFYYWDTYWALRGQLHSELYDTARGIIDNFLAMVKEYGFVPNGGRVYYLNRSQPPLLTLMVRDYVKATNDVEFFKSRAQVLEEEFNFWVTNRTVQVDKDGKTYTLARYYVKSSSPRPESYSEDYNDAHILPEEERDTFYDNIKSAAESGWDFSTRWFIKEGTNQGNLTNIDTQHIIPVDLNAFLYGVATSLSELFTMAGDTAQATRYAHIADTWREAVTAILWNEDVGTWLDYDILNHKQREYFQASNLVPLWTGCYDQANVEHIATKSVDYLTSSTVLDYLGGIPTTLEHSGQQWDLPNAWPPLQHMVIMGLDQTHQPRAMEMAFKLAKRWVHSNYLAYHATTYMYEKYNAEVPGGYGIGGEYIVQAGFGWTNGVILDLLTKYGDRLSSTDQPSTE